MSARGLIINKLDKTLCSRIADSYKAPLPTFPLTEVGRPISGYLTFAGANHGVLSTIDFISELPMRCNLFATVLPSHPYSKAAFQHVRLASLAMGHQALQVTSLVVNAEYGLLTSVTVIFGKKPVQHVSCSFRFEPRSYQEIVLQGPLLPTMMCTYRLLIAT